MIDRQSVDDALDRIVDPCSSALGEPLGLREMGLIPAIEIDDELDAVSVTMCVTSPCCAYGPAMALAAQAELAGLDGVRSASVTIDHSRVWTPEDIEHTAAVRLGARRRRTVDLAQVRPHDWSTWPAERTGRDVKPDLAHHERSERSTA